MTLFGAWRNDPMALFRRVTVSGWTGVLAIVGGWTFFFLKHDRILGCVIPFSRDPFDAVGSFAVIAAVPLSLLVLFRTLMRPADDGDARLARARSALLLGFAVMWLSDLIAMAAHPDWYGAGGAEITFLVAGQFLVTVATLAALSWRSAHAGRSLLLALVSIPIFIAVLWIFPQSIMRTVAGEFAAVAFGILWLFAQVALWTEALAPASDPIPGWTRRLAIPGAALAGALVGALLMLLEARESGGLAPGRELLVGLAFVGGGAFGVGLGYAFLRRPLGLP